MAEENYRRLTCGGCTAEFVPPTSRGRPRQFCADCRPPKHELKPVAPKRPKVKVPKPLRSRDCRGCGVAFTGNSRARNCSRACAKRTTAKSRYHADRAALLALNLPKPQYDYQCATCQVPFQSPRRHRIYCSTKCNHRAAHLKQQAATTHERGLLYDKVCAECGAAFRHRWKNVAMYCSKACKSRAYGARNGKCRSTADLLRQRAGLAVASAIADLAKARASVERALRLATSKAKREALAARRATHCGHCAAPMPPAAHGSARYCSTDCAKFVAKNSETSKASQRASRQARKALIRSVTVEAFDPIAILERDGWRCQICNVRTPRKLRGTFKANAPELDHIVPLSDGGAHTPENTQCACRACNGEKSNKAVIGQMGLFTSIANEAISKRRRPSRPQTQNPPLGGFSISGAPT